MLLFNREKLFKKRVKNKFQYILCYYSTKIKKNFNRIFYNFNTSYVIIQPMCIKNMRKSRIYFNTSYVIIQHQESKESNWIRYFNTSYVIIQPTKNRHFCILLISINHDLKPFFQHFTNHSIENQLFVRNHVFTPFDRLFQKITW